tara:strand:- start:782 stop:1006 length:225 start_codon:yes stop_codon:yes gene_type:complete
MVGACLEVKATSPSHVLNKLPITERIEVVHKNHYKLGVVFVSLFVVLSFIQSPSSKFGQSLCEKHNSVNACQVW